MKRNELSLHQALFDSYSQTQQRIVAYSKDRTFTAKDFTDAIKALTFSISKSKNVKSIAVCVEDAYNFSIAFIAAMYAKKTPVLLGNITAHTFDDIESKADLVLSDLDISHISVPALNIKQLVNESLEEYSSLLNTDRTAFEERYFSALDEMSPIIFYTSGTTGKSKRVNKTLRSMQIDITCSFEIADNLESYDRIKLISTVPPYHMYGLTYRIFMPILRHLPMTSFMIRYPEELENYADENIILISSPAFIKRLDTAIRAPHIRLCQSAGSALPDDAALKFYNWCHCGITEIYGSTESNSMAHRYNKGDRPLFIPFSAVRFVKIEDGYELDSLMSDGYNRIDDNLEFEGPYFRITGRKDKIVKIEENRVSLTQIEKLLKDNPLIKDAVALVITKNSRTCIGAVCILNKRASGSTDVAPDSVFSKKTVVMTLKEYLRGYLPAVAIPRYFRFVENIPVNHMGKRITPLLEELFNDQA